MTLFSFSTGRGLFHAMTKIDLQAAAGRTAAHGSLSENALLRGRSKVVPVLDVNSFKHLHNFEGLDSRQMSLRTAVPFCFV